MKKNLLFFCSITCLFALALAYPTSGRGPAPIRNRVKERPVGKPVKLFIRKLHCEKTTEAGEDEVYLIVAGQDNRRNFQYRLPADASGEEAGHWNLNDGRPPRSVENVVLWTGNLDDGESANLVVIGMEEDGGVPGGWAIIGGAALRKVPDPTTQAIGAVAGLVGVLSNAIGIRDKDDFLGSFSVNVANVRGQIRVTYSIGERMEDTAHHYAIFPGMECVQTREFWFKGDGSTYFVYIRTDPVDPSYDRAFNDCRR